MINDEENRLSNLATMEAEPLYSLRGVFPFDFFPNVVTVYRNKVSIVYKTFFIMTETVNVPIENIDHITVNSSFPFASLEISSRFFSETPLTVTTLRPSEAKKAMEIIDGLRIAGQQHIDVSQIPTDVLLRDVLKVGLITS